jgi:hypothetical protein
MVGACCGADFGERSCQTATNFIKCNALEISTIRPMIYTLCYRLVLILLNHFIFQFATHFLSARGLGQAYLLTSFGLCGWFFARLGNVYDCEALALFFLFAFYLLFQFF